MNGHKFKLETVLDFREQMEDMLKKEFSALQQKVKEAEEKLVELNEYYEKETGAVLARGEMTPAELAVYKGYLGLIRERIEGAKAGHRIAMERSESKREELVSASRDKKVMETLKSNDLKEHIKAENKREIGLIDEHNVQRYKNGARNGKTR